MHTVLKRDPKFVCLSVCLSRFSVTVTVSVTVGAYFTVITRICARINDRNTTPGVIVVLPPSVGVKKCTPFKIICDGAMRFIA